MYKLFLRLLDSRLFALFVKGLANCEKPHFAVQYFLKLFVNTYKINLLEMEKPLTQYKSLMELFTRKLMTDVRPIDTDKGTIVSPSDGVLECFDEIKTGILYQIKHKPYALEELIKTTKEYAMKHYEGGFCTTIYLSPRDYHRVHHPISDVLESIEYIPGRLLPVNHYALNNFEGVFSHNKRVIFNYKSGLKMIMVGALNVGDIVCSNMKVKFKGKYKKTSMNIVVKKGDEAGIFQFGSTVILLFGKNYLENNQILCGVGEKVKMGKVMAYSQDHV